VLDVIVPTGNRGLVALNGNRGWEIWNTSESTNGNVVVSPLGKDINNDGVVDFVSVTDQGQVTAVSAQNGKAWQLWTVDVPKVRYSSPAVLQTKEQSLVIVATASDGVYAIDGVSGRVVWNQLSGQKFSSSPVVADVNGDRIPDVLLVSENGNTFVLSAAFGEDQNSGNIAGSFIATTALYDVTDDDIPELFMLSRDGKLFISDANRLRPELTVDLTGSSKLTASPLLADINNDGLLDIVVASGNGVVTAYSMNRTTAKGKVIQGEFLSQYQD
jgi:hypothetical protein